MTVAMQPQPQYTYDGMGNKIGVFIPIDEYERLTGHVSDAPVEQWEIDLIDKRMAEFRANPDDGISWKVLRQQMTDDDGVF